MDLYWQKKTDLDGKTMPEDGRSTIIAILELWAEYEKEGDESWCPKLRQVFTNGVEGRPVTYPKDDSLPARRVYQAGRHSEENNKFAHTDVYTLVLVARFALQQGGNISAKAEEYLMAQHGKASRRAANKWVLAAKQLHEVVVDTLQGMDYLKTSYILENDFFVCGGARVKETLLAEPFQQRALKLLKDEYQMSKITTSAKQFCDVTCRSLKVVQRLDESLVRRFGEALLTGNARSSLINSLCTASGLRKVFGCLQSAVPLEGKSDQEVGIMEVRQYVSELERCKAGGDKPKPTDNQGQSPVTGGSSASQTGTFFADVRDAADFAALCTVDGENQEHRLSEADREHVLAVKTYISSVSFSKSVEDIRQIGVSRKDTRTLIVIDAGTSGKVGYATLIDLAHDIMKVNTQLPYLVLITLLRTRYDLLSEVKMKAEEKFLEGALVGGHVPSPNRACIGRRVARICPDRQ